MAEELTEKNLESLLEEIYSDPERYIAPLNPEGGSYCPICGESAPEGEEVVHRDWCSR